MKLYNSIGPNPHVVRMFIEELGIELETVEVDLMAGNHKILVRGYENKGAVKFKLWWFRLLTHIFTQHKNDTIKNQYHQ